MDGWDVIVVGGGNAGLCAALATADRGARVLLLERARRAERGGNSFVTAGAFRFPYEGVADVARLVDDPLLGTPELPGLFACGELVGGLFHHNYLGGSGLAAGAVFGRLAGAGAAAAPRGTAG